MLANIIGKSVRINAIRTLASQSGPLPMPKTDFDFKLENFKGRPSIEDSIKTRQQHMSKVMYAYYKEPLQFVQGHKQYLFDSKGRRYLDFLAGVATISVGHCHPKVMSALERQLKNLWHTTMIYYYPSIQEYTEKLIKKLPKHLDTILFVNSGSEANDLALFLARLYTGRNEVVSLRHAYHGMSPYVMPATALGTWRYSVPTSIGAIQTMNPDPYRGPWGGKACRNSITEIDRECSCQPGECNACDQYINQLQDVLVTCTPKGRVAGFIAESIQGVSGAIQFPKDFIKRTSEIVKSNGGLLLMDEVQTGFGRTGSHFWGFEHHGVEPDIISMAKGIANGFPMGAVATRKEIADKLADSLWFNTFGGNPMACAVAGSVLDVIDEEKLQENAHVVGSYIINEMTKLKNEISMIGDVRGRGLMIGVELVEDRKTRKPFGAEKTMQIVEHAKEMGLLIGRGGINSNVIRIIPPLCITKEDADFAVSVLKTAFMKV